MNQFSTKQLYQSHMELLHKRSIKGQKKSNTIIKRNVAQSINTKDLTKKTLVSRWEELYNEKKEKGALSNKDTVGKTVTLDGFSEGQRENLNHRFEGNFLREGTGPLSKGEAGFGSLGVGAGPGDVKMSARTDGAGRGQGPRVSIGNDGLV
jgi:hypothetical protein